jgi:hypothetical protein
MLAWDIKQGMLMRDFTLPANEKPHKKQLQKLKHFLKNYSKLHTTEC